MIRRHLLSFLMAGTLATAAVAVSTLSSPGDWKISGPFGGTASSLAIDPERPQTVLAGAMNSLLFRSDDAGANWSLIDLPKRTLSEVTAILIDPADSNHYFAGMTAADGGGLFESHDGGKTWLGVRDMSAVGVRALAAAPSEPSRFVAGTWHGVMLSDDCGKTWTRVSDPQNAEMQGITSIAIDSRDPNIIYAGTAHLPWKTTDGGKTWESIHTGMIDDSDVFSIYVDPSTPTSILASACSGIYSSSDRGELWHKLMGIPNTSRRTHVVREDPANPNIIYAGTTTGLFKSVNHGTTWRTLTNTQVNAIAFNPQTPSGMYLALEYDGVGKSSDQGEAMELVNNGFVDRRLTAITAAGSKLVALETQEGESSGLFVSSNQGETWTQIRSMRGLSGVHLRVLTGVASGDRVLVAASAHQMYKSVDGGELWKPLPVRRIIPPAPESEKPKATTRSRPGTRRSAVRRPAAKPKPIIKEISPAEINGLYSLRSGEKDLLFAATDLGLLKSDDLGEHWLLIDVPGTTAAGTLYMPRAADGRMLLRSGAGLAASNDFGDHWTPVAFPLSASDINDVALPTDASAPLLVATRVGLYMSSDQGSTWSLVRKGLPASTFASVVYDPARHAAFAVAYGTLYETSDAGESWSVAPSLRSGLRIRQLWVRDDSSPRLYGITSDLGILFRD